ncbi:unnamed protein product [Notodromas monacha]|uniref:Uncharacterized protein n=1 Tax=Notodromas monacha TaxID=399045 RepID=A0A7R9BLT1_9CRUS|nr:unnamed protein product [Notodromas monacha]CAG0916498.1 unnamed protein product [Notodromas monacha]
MRVLLSAGANILRRDWKPICLSQRSLFGLEDEHKTPFKAQRKTDKWRLRDGASESETMVYVGPWSDTARWLQSGLLGLSAMTATGAFLHVTGVSPLMDTVLPSAGSLDELTTGEFFFAAAVTMTACAIAQYTTSKLVLRIYHLLLLVLKAQQVYRNNGTALRSCQHLMPP